MSNISKPLRCIYTDEWKNNNIDLNISIFEFKIRFKSIAKQYNYNISLYDNIINKYLSNEQLNYITILNKYKYECLKYGDTINTNIYDIRKNKNEIIEKVLTISGLIKSPEIYKQIEKYITQIETLNITTESKKVIKWIYFNQPDLFIKEIDKLIDILQEVYDKRIHKINEIIMNKMKDGNKCYNKLIITKLLNNYLNSLNTTDIILNTKHLHPFANQYIDYIETIYKLVESIINYNFDKFECEYLIYNNDDNYDDFRTNFIDESMNKYNIDRFFNVNEFDTS